MVALLITAKLASLQERNGREGQYFKKEAMISRFPRQITS